MVDWVTKASDCKPKSKATLKQDPTLLAVGDLILLSNFPKPWKLICALKNIPLSLECCTYRVINKIEFCEYSFSAGLY